ncbi:MAG: bifunctional 5,10-methylene-tetrahydrofolate dehydrogenase/5,10-methylene-tetrahydrofolate cyclohydrolase [Candidatus Fraserbacteria bacterium RBG_16_55_9]|uniref:Bifunctional protein FolD n=1 Tax=Fraserbacteria sp. (strain RBG_16_55_9) TaxID=1817864 RepID=A0A1F5V416_FRAXR|nr:MAG: bifunctional 5,10-methylene-tetrahydrofolate dehydrogenase/5,10-methylene-tetrahydrofolate cyclohydrolase [Candidatus Fraserbacteria bacterium RBG_16_55_9]
MGMLIDGKKIAQQIREELKIEVARLQQEQGVTPGLAAVLIGDNPASKVYVNMKAKACDETGIFSEKILLPKETAQQDLMATIHELNRDDRVHGILIQLPLPEHIDERAVLQEVDPHKDVDGFHPVNLGKLLSAKFWNELPPFVPCTPAGVIKLIESTGTKIEGKNAVVVGRSVIVGKPVAMLLLAKQATVTVAHSRTTHLKEICRQADILVVAAGRPKLVTADDIQPGAIVIDVGTNRMPDGKLVGDVDFEAVKEVAGFITPVPGGVGPMTIAMLLKNTVEAAKGMAAMLDVVGTTS